MRKIPGHLLYNILDKLVMLREKGIHILHYCKTIMNDRTVYYKNLLKLVELCMSSVPECSNKHALSCHLESLEGI